MSGHKLGITMIVVHFLCNLMDLLFAKASRGTVELKKPSLKLIIPKAVFARHQGDGEPCQGLKLALVL